MIEVFFGEFDDCPCNGCKGSLVLSLDNQLLCDCCGYNATGRRIEVR